MNTTLVLVATVIVVAIVVAVVNGRRDRGRADTTHDVATAKTPATATDRAKRMAMTVAILAGVFTTLLTVASFTLSYAHLENVAVANGVPRGILAWMWPGTIDTFIVVGELLILFAAILGLGFAWWGWGLTVGGSATSIAFNVAGVGEGAPLMQYAVAGAPPVAALFAFGALMHQVRRYVAMTVTAVAVATVTNDDHVTAPMAVPNTPETVTVAIPPRPTVAAPVAVATPRVSVATPRVSVAKRVTDTMATAVTAADKALVTVDAMAMTALMGRPYVATAKSADDRVAMVVAMLKENPDVDGDAVATAIGKSPRTGRRLLAVARGVA